MFKLKLCIIGFHRGGTIIDREYMGKTCSKGTGSWFTKYKLTLQCPHCGTEYIRNVIT